jgi:hypothetical protein
MRTDRRRRARSEGPPRARSAAAMARLPPRRHGCGREAVQRSHESVQQGRLSVERGLPLAVAPRERAVAWSRHDLARRLASPDRGVPVWPDGAVTVARRDRAMRFVACAIEAPREPARFVLAVSPAAGSRVGVVRRPAARRSTVRGVRAPNLPPPARQRSAQPGGRAIGPRPRAKTIIGSPHQRAANAS